MSALEVYKQVQKTFSQVLCEGVPQSSIDRLSVLSVGIIASKSSAPSQIAAGLATLSLSSACEASIERRLRRIQNDKHITAELCFHPFVRACLSKRSSDPLYVIIDPTTQEDRIVMLTACVWYRGRALPLAWMIWAGNKPMKGDRFWVRVKKLLDTVATLLPANVPVIVLADRAFGTPSFTDLVQTHGWDYIVRVQGQTHVCDLKGRDMALNTLVEKGQRKKLGGDVFKKQGWRKASAVCYWSTRCDGPLILVTSLPPCWSLIETYKRRYPIEATFRDYKSKGWHFEQGQVTLFKHLKRLLVGMALACWITILAGVTVAGEYLSKKPSGKRRTIPRHAKRSLFALGLTRLKTYLQSQKNFTLNWVLTDWGAPAWYRQADFHYRRAFVLATRN